MGHTIPAGHAIPPHPGPASTFSRTSWPKYGISKTVSSASAVVGARGGTNDSKDGNAAEDDVVDTEDDRDRAEKA